MPDSHEDLVMGTPPTEIAAIGQQKAHPLHILTVSFPRGWYNKQTKTWDTRKSAVKQSSQSNFDP